MSDMWAVGCLGYELCAGQRLPHTFDLEVADILQSTEDYARLIDLSKIPARFGATTYHIIENCLAWEPSRRWTAAKIIQYLHDYVSEDSHQLETRRIFAGPHDDPFAAVRWDQQTIQPDVLREPRDSPSNSGSSGDVEAGVIARNRTDVSKHSQIDSATGGTYAWTTGAHNDIGHVDIIDAGGGGEVHKV